MDTLVREATGLERATAHLMRTSLRKRQEQAPGRLRNKLEKVAQLALEKDTTFLLSKSTAGFSVLTAAHVGVRILLPFLSHRVRRNAALTLGAMAAASANRIRDNVLLSVWTGNRMSTLPCLASEFIASGGRVVKPIGRRGVEEGPLTAVLQGLDPREGAKEEQRSSEGRSQVLVRSGKYPPGCSLEAVHN